MEIIKFIILLFVFLITTYIGILISKKYLNREKDLKEIKKALNLFSTKMKFTYETIPNIFNEISTMLKPNISEIFKIASKKMNELPAGNAWNYAVDKSNTNLTKEDKEILKGLSNLLGKVDINGQVLEIELVDTFLDSHIKLAEEEKIKYVKMYKTLGITTGLAIVIMLI